MRLPTATGPRLDHPRAVAGEDFVECRGELAVPVANQEPEPPGPIAEARDQVPACWAVQGLEDPADRGCADQPVRPQPCRQEPDQRGEDRAVGPVEPGPGMGAAPHGDLVPEHEQFGVLEAGDRPSGTSQPQTGRR
jgi:hypothetical protein